MADYYQVLGVSKNATQKEIKQAYKRKAKQAHPDVNKGDKKAQERFKDINRAYRVLSNPDKRAAYDRMGHATFEQARKQSGNTGPGGFNGFGFDFDLGDLFGFGSSRQQTGFSDIFEDLFAQAFTQIQVQVPISLTTAVLGGTTTFTVHGQEITLKIPPGTQSQTTFRLTGQGPTVRNNRRADVLATVVVMIPKQTTKKQRELLAKLQESGL